MGITREEVEKWLDELIETQTKMDELASKYSTEHIRVCYPQPKEILIYEGIHTIAGLLGGSLSVCLSKSQNGLGYYNKYFFLYKGYTVLQLGDR